MSNEDCSDMGYGNQITNFMLCAAAPNEPEKDACQVRKGINVKKIYGLRGDNFTHYEIGLYLD